jgi:DNA repair exonuclease SbcCD ATPase subunit
MDPVESGLSFRGDSAEYSEVQKRLEDLEQQLLQFRTKVQETRSGEAESLNLSKELSSKDEYEYSGDEEEVQVDPRARRAEEKRPEAKVPPLVFNSQPAPQMPFGFPNFPQPGIPNFPQPGMFPSMPSFPNLGVPLDPAAKARTRKMLLDQSKLLEELARKMKREAAPREMPESVEIAISELRNRCERLENDKQRLASQVERLKQPQDLPEVEKPNRLELKQAALEAGALKNDLESLRAQFTQVARERDHYKAQNQALEKEVEDLKSALAQKTALLDRPSRENTSLQSQISRLQQQNKELLLSYQTLQKEFDQIVVDRHSFNRGDKKPQPSLNIFDQSQPYGGETKPPPARRAATGPQDSHDIAMNLEAKLASIQGEKQRVRSI